jgi:aminopeptidase-like protein
MITAISKPKAKTLAPKSNSHASADATKYIAKYSINKRANDYFYRIKTIEINHAFKNIRAKVFESLSTYTSAGADHGWDTYVRLQS